MQAEYIKIATYHTCRVSQRETYRDVKTKASENTILPKLFSPDVPLEKTHWLQMSSSVIHSKLTQRNQLMQKERRTYMQDLSSAHSALQYFTAVLTSSGSWLAELLHSNVWSRF